jgi:HK97 family phage portal protein
MRNWLKAVRQAWQPKTARKSVGDPVQSWLNSDDDLPGGVTLVNGYQQSAWVYACVQAIAEQIALTPFRFSLGQDKGEQILERGTVVNLFDRPHPHLSRFEFWELFIAHLLLRGRVFLMALDSEDRVLRLDGAEAPTRLLLLDPDRVQRICSAHELQGWRYHGHPNTPLASQVLLPEEVLFVRQPNPFDFWDGLSPYSVALLAAQSDYAAAQFMKGLMVNNADSGLIITTEAQLPDEHREQVLSALRSRKRRVGFADQPLVLWNNLKVQKPTVSTADLEFLANRKFNRLEICAVFRVPQEILGFTEDANRSVSDSARLNFIENRIAPLCRRIEVALEPILRLAAGRGQEIYGFFDVDSLPVMQQARRERFNAARGAFEMGVPLAICNQVFDLGLPGNLIHAERSYLPTTMQEVTASVPNPNLNLLTTDH